MKSTLSYAFWCQLFFHLDELPKGQKLDFHCACLRYDDDIVSVSLTFKTPNGEEKIHTIPMMKIWGAYYHYRPEQVARKIQKLLIYQMEEFKTEIATAQELMNSDLEGNVNDL